MQCQGTTLVPWEGSQDGLTLVGEDGATRPHTREPGHRAIGVRSSTPDTILCKRVQGNYYRPRPAPHRPGGGDLALHPLALFSCPLELGLLCGPISRHTVWIHWNFFSETFSQASSTQCASLPPPMQYGYFPHPCLLLEAMGQQAHPTLGQAGHTQTCESSSSASPPWVLLHPLVMQDGWPLTVGCLCNRPLPSLQHPSTTDSDD